MIGQKSARIGAEIRVDYVEWAAKMADDPTPSNFANNGALLVALLSVVALAFNHYAPRQVNRPAGGEAQFHHAASVQDVECGRGRIR